MFSAQSPQLEHSTPRGARERNREDDGHDGCQGRPRRDSRRGGSRVNSRLAEANTASPPVSALAYNRPIPGSSNGVKLMPFHL